MVNMTIAIPKELQKLIKKHNDVKWSEVARKALWEKAKDMELLDSITSKSAMTMQDVEELDVLIKQGIAKAVKKAEKA